MVQTINKSVCRGVAGKRVGKVKGVVIHNTWDNATATSHIQRLASYNNNQLARGFAHYFVDHNSIVRVEDTFNCAWHVANTDGNTYYLGYEARGDRSTPRAEFLAGEQNALKQAAKDLKYYGLTPNRQTVRLHSEFSATECPKRSLIEHLGWDSTKALPGVKRDQMKDYFIAEIKKHMNGGDELVDGLKGKSKKLQDIKVGWLPKGSKSIKFITNYLDKNKLRYKLNVTGNRVVIVSGWYRVDHKAKFRFERFLAENNYAYDVITRK